MKLDFECENILKIRRLVRTYFQNWTLGAKRFLNLDVWVQKHFENWVFGCEHMLKFERLGAKTFCCRYLFGSTVMSMRHLDQHVDQHDERHDEQHAMVGPST